MSELAGTEAQLEQEPLDDVHAAERLPAEIEPAILRKYFSLTRADLDEVERCRGSANKLGFSAQLCTLRWRGHFLNQSHAGTSIPLRSADCGFHLGSGLVDTRDVPAVVIEVLAPQLGLLPMLITNYPRDEKTRWAHLERIRRHLGFVRCAPAQRQHLLDHLTRVARSAPRTETLRRAAHAWLLEHHVVRPRRTTLRDLVATARETGLQQTFDALTRDLSEAQRSQLDGLLATVETPVNSDESPKVVDDEAVDEFRSRLDRFKTPPHCESPAVLLGLLERLETIEKLDFAGWPPLAEVHPAARRLLAGWGYHYDAWNLRRFQPPKRYAVLVCFLQAALASTTDAVVEAQDKLITTVHSKAKKRRDELLRAGEEAKRRAVEVLEVVGEMVLDESIPDAQLRNEILWRIPSEEMAILVDGCHQLRDGDDGSHLSLTARWYSYTREYSPALLDKTPFRFAEQSALGRAVQYLRNVNREHRRKLGAEAPTDFVPPRWRRHVLGRSVRGEVEISRPHYELALLTTLNEQLKSGDVTVVHSRRWTDFEDYLIPRDAWVAEREQH